MPLETEQLSAAQRGKVRRLSAPKELAPDDEGGELNIIPFLDIITNVLMFVLATVAVTFTTMIDSHPPSAGGRAPTTPTLNLNVIINDDGFVISAARQRVATGCRGYGSGVAVPVNKSNAPKIDDPTDPKEKPDYNDYDALKRCAEYLKTQLPEYAGEKQVAISANSDVQYKVIIRAMDALRRSEKGDDLFPEVNFGVPQ